MRRPRRQQGPGSHPQHWTSDSTHAEVRGEDQSCPGRVEPELPSGEDLIAFQEVSDAPIDDGLHQRV